MAQIHINTGSAANNGSGDFLRTAGISTEKNFNELFFILDQKPLPFPYTGSAQILGNLGITGSLNTDTISASKFFVPMNTVVDADNASIVKIKGSNYIYFDNNTSQEQILVNPGANGTPRGMLSCQNLQFGSNQGPKVIFNGVTDNREFVFKGTTENFLLCGNGDNLNVAIKQDSQTVAKDFDVLGSISSSEYFSSNLPTTDPEIAGQWFTQDSSEICGEGNYKILCVSQGPTNFIRDGLRFMHAPRITGADSILYVSPKSGNPAFRYKNSIRGAKPNDIFFDSRLGTATNYNYYEDNSYSNPLGYNWFSTYGQSISTTSSMFNGEDGHTFIFWWKGLSILPNSSVVNNETSTNSNYYMGFQATSFNLSRQYRFYISGQNPADPNSYYLNTDKDIRLQFGDTETAKITNYFSSSFYNDYSIDIDDWHMIAIEFDGTSGAGVNYNLYISQSGGGWQTSGTTGNFFDVRQREYFGIGGGGGSTINSLSSTRSSVFTSSLFMYYSKSLSEQEINDMYGYFSASHGL